MMDVKRCMVLLVCLSLGGGCASRAYVRDALTWKPGVDIEQDVNIGSSDQAEGVLMPADEGFCFLTKIHGQFEGAGEYVRVYVEDGSWKYRTQTRAGGSMLNVTIRCIRGSRR